MSKKICLTGVKPTHMPHLGNYIGSIRPAIELANSGQYDGFFFIADYHSLIGVHNASDLSRDIYEVAAVWLACGLNPDTTTLYKQSDIPEILELNWILSCFSSKGLLNRAHAYKAKLAQNEQAGKDPDYGVNMGLYNYPVLMAADILFIGSDVVPVGEDQLQHIEIARDIASSFNHHYGEVLKLPEGITQKGALLPGLDGRKMSKSYGNHIPLFLPEKKLKKTINKITTDSTPPESPKNPDDSLIFDIYKYFANEQQQSDLAKRYQEGIGWGHAKLELFDVVNNELSDYRKKYNYYIENPSEIDSILDAGAKRVREIAQKRLLEVKKAIGVTK